jgi:hypothetical protein
MQIQRIDHSTAKGEYVVTSSYGPKVSVTLFGPATLSECEKFIQTKAIVGIPA